MVATLRRRYEFIKDVDQQLKNDVYDLRTELGIGCALGFGLGNLAPELRDSSFEYKGYTHRWQDREEVRGGMASARELLSNLGAPVMTRGTAE